MDPVIRLSPPLLLSLAAIVAPVPCAAAAGDAVPAEGEVERLVKRLREPGDASRRSAARRVGELGARAREAVPALAALLDEADAELRRDAVFALARIGPDAAETAEAVAGLLGKDVDSRVRANAAWCLEAVKATGRKEIAALLRALKDDDGKVVANAARAAGALAPPDRSLPSALAAALAHADWTARVNAAWAIGRLGPDGKAATPALLKSLGDDVETVRLAAAGALALVREDERRAIPLLAKALDAAVVEPPAIPVVPDGAPAVKPPREGDATPADAGPEDGPLRRLLGELGGARRNMAWCMGRYATQDREAGRVLARARDLDRSETVRAAAETALARRDSRAFPAAPEEREREFPAKGGQAWSVAVRGGIEVVFRYEL